MKNNKEKATRWFGFSLKKKIIWIILGFLVILLKIVAIIDIFKKYRHYEMDRDNLSSK